LAWASRKALFRITFRSQTSIGAKEVRKHSELPGL
jgi:hypothetical protein